MERAETLFVENSNNSGWEVDLAVVVGDVSATADGSSVRKKDNPQIARIARIPVEDAVSFGPPAVSRVLDIRSAW
ncbi:MAG: hypothetical protein Q8O42_03560 [Acidobacteriota bacterium]|nr:hypothetical protein [Acidobacteriota bacterium]